VNQTPRYHKLTSPVNQPLLPPTTGPWTREPHTTSQMTSPTLPSTPTTTAPTKFKSAMDLKTRTVLFQGQSSNGLYPIPLTLFPRRI
ncbi:hypothetical protein LINGRAHAP2_LOCUS8947, partial [Linum grandiflorum]